METGAIVKSQEITKDVPVGLQYFQAVDVLTQNATADDRGYLDILVYDQKDSQPKVKILRQIIKYKDGSFEKQDELELAGKGNRLQLNAKCDAQGNYIKFPETLSENGSHYLESVVACFKDLLALDGASVKINNRKHLVSKNGVWVEVERKSAIPKLQEPKKELPE